MSRGLAAQPKLPVISDQTVELILQRLQAENTDKYLTEAFIKLKTANPNLVTALKQFLRRHDLDSEEIKAALYGMIITHELYQQQAAISGPSLKKPTINIAFKSIVLVLVASMLTYLGTSIYGHATQPAEAYKAKATASMASLSVQICKNNAVLVPCALKVQPKPAVVSAPSALSSTQSTAAPKKTKATPVTTPTANSTPSQSPPPADPTPTPPADPPPSDPPADPPPPDPGPPVNPTQP
jgi:hypothetical protein